MLIEIYQMTAAENTVSITLEAVCDAFSSFLWDIEYFQCGQFELYIAATPETVAIFQTGRLVGRKDDTEHYGLIESVRIQTDAENGDYLTVSGHFLMILLSRRIIYPTLVIKDQTSYGEIIHTAIRKNCLQQNERFLPGLQLGEITGDCWKQETHLQISYANLMEWIYKICELVGGTANISLVETKPNSRNYQMMFTLSEGIDRSILQDTYPHVIFSDAFHNLLTFDYLRNAAAQQNAAYTLGAGEGEARKRAFCTLDPEPTRWERYEVYVDARDLSEETQNDAGESVTIPEEEYLKMLEERGRENLSSVEEISESSITATAPQEQYPQDYQVGDWVTVQQTRFGLSQNRIRLIGMIESFDQNGRSLTPTFQEG